MTLFELSEVGGPWGRRLARRRRGFADLPTTEAGRDLDPEQRAQARWVWTQSAVSELASAKAFAEIAAALVAAGAPIDLVAAAGEFVADEVVHAELSGALAMALGGAAPLEVDLERLVRPAAAREPVLRAAELLLRTSCIGEVLTLPLLRVAARESSCPVIREVLAQIARDEGAHAELGWWFLDWADGRLDDAARAHLSEVASFAITSFAPLFGTRCEGGSNAGVLGCQSFDPTFSRALERQVTRPLAERGIFASTTTCGP